VTEKFQENARRAADLVGLTAMSILLLIRAERSFCRQHPLAFAALMGRRGATSVLSALPNVAQPTGHAGIGCVGSALTSWCQEGLALRIGPRRVISVAGRLKARFPLQEQRGHLCWVDAARDGAAAPGPGVGSLASRIRLSTTNRNGRRTASFPCGPEPDRSRREG